MSSRYALALALFAYGCLDAPRFEVADDGRGNSRAVGQGGNDDMVRIPETTFADASSLPADNDDDDDDENNGKGKPKDGGSSGGGGSSSGGSSSGTPPPPPGVSVPAFWLDAREVTVAAYGACVDAGACTTPHAGEGCTYVLGLLDHPVTCVTRAQAQAFCAYRGKRLVRNMEFTAAAAGSARRPFPWGVEPPSGQRLNACGSECGGRSMYNAQDGYAKTAPVGSFPLGRSPDGVHDLAGNVAEWVDASSASITRGGHHADADAAQVASFSLRAIDEEAAPTVGFRCARD